MTVAVNARVGRFGLATKPDGVLRLGWVWRRVGFHLEHNALLGYRFLLFGAAAQVFGGYKALAQNYKSASGTSETRWDTVLRGPVIGTNVRF